MSYFPPELSLDRNRKPPRKGLHYYGDIVRRLFLLAAVLMIVSIPLVEDSLPIPFALSLGAMIGLAIVSGFINPVHRFTGLINVVSSVAGFAVFEVAALYGFNKYQWMSFFFLVNQLLALIFFFAIYFSTKTLRGYFTPEKR
jgi:hypothetical protein